MKRIVVIIISFWCALTASAVTYSSPYRGTGRTGHVYSSHCYSSMSGKTQAPVASMGSTSSYISHGSTSTMIVSPHAATGFTTAASSIHGGVMASTTYERISAPKRAMGHPGDPGYCPDCIDLDGDDVCDRCGCSLYEGCFCESESGYCWCPINDSWDVWLFMATLCATYALVKGRGVICSKECVKKSYFQMKCG